MRRWPTGPRVRPRAAPRLGRRPRRRRRRKRLPHPGTWRPSGRAPGRSSGAPGDRASPTSRGYRSAGTRPTARGSPGKSPSRVSGCRARSLWEDRVYVVIAASLTEDSEFRIGLYGDVAPVQNDSAHRWELRAYDLTSGAPVWTTELRRGVPIDAPAHQVEPGQRHPGDRWRTDRHPAREHGRAALPRLRRQPALGT